MTDSAGAACAWAQGQVTSLADTGAKTGAWRHDEDQDEACRLRRWTEHWRQRGSGSMLSQGSPCGEFMSIAWTGDFRWNETTMAKELLFRQEVITLEHASEISCSLEVADGRVILTSDFVCSSPEGQDRFSTTHTCVVSNPIALSVAVTAVATKYALCVAGSVVTSTTKELYLAYQESKPASVTARVPLKTRAASFAKAIKKRKHNILAGAVAPFAGCAAGVAFVP